jgi:hypothetical protein
MKRYVQLSGTLFTVVALIQLLRVIQRWPVQVATTTIPVSASVVAFLVAGSLAIWALRLAKGAP